MSKLIQHYELNFVRVEMHKRIAAPLQCRATFRARGAVSLPTTNLCAGDDCARFMERERHIAIFRHAVDQNYYSLPQIVQVLDHATVQTEKLMLFPFGKVSFPS